LDVADEIETPFRGHISALTVTSIEVEFENFKFLDLPSSYPPQLYFSVCFLLYLCTILGHQSRDRRSFFPLKFMTALKFEAILRCMSSSVSAASNATFFFGERALMLGSFRFKKPVMNLFRVLPFACFCP
jgi:hypothetical protein